MNVKEAIELINTSDNCYSLFNAEDLLKGCKFKNRQDYESNRWYIMATDIYEVDDGYIGVSGVSELKSEIMDYSDTDEQCFAEEYQVIQTITYVPKTE